MVLGSIPNGAGTMVLLFSVLLLSDLVGSRATLFRAGVPLSEPLIVISA